MNDTEEKDFSSSYFLGAFLIGFLCLPIGLNFDLAFFLPWAVLVFYALSFSFSLNKSSITLLFAKAYFTIFKGFDLSYSFYYS